VRTFGAFIKDFFTLKLRNFWDRFAVITNIKKDPYNTFSGILSLQKKYKVPTIFFFLVADYTTFDTNVSPAKNKFKLLIK